MTGEAIHAHDCPSFQSRIVLLDDDAEKELIAACRAGRTRRSETRILLEGVATLDDALLGPGTVTR